MAYLTYSCEAPSMVTMCQNSFGDITCSDGNKIDIKSAEFGRSTSDTCRVHPSKEYNHYYANKKCHATDALQITQKFCNGKASCHLKATSQQFGDPCPGTYKYLTVKYFCEKTIEKEIVTTEASTEKEIEKVMDKIETVVHQSEREKSNENVVICPFKVTSFDCPSINRIKISTALLVTHASNKCSGSKPPNNATPLCTTSDKILEILKPCNGKTSCQIDVSNVGFGEPCSINNYLDLLYTCEGPQPLTVCQTSHSQIQCPNNEIIQLFSATFGRTSTETCKPKLVTNNRFYLNINCRAMGAFAKVKELCAGKNVCDLHATTAVFGNPCPDTYKYLELKYLCTDLSSIQNPTDALKTESRKIENSVIFKESRRKFEVLNACPNILHTLKCPPNHVIRGISTSLRTDHPTLDTDWQYSCDISERYSTQKCLSREELEQMFESCDGHNQCNLDLRNSGLMPCDERHKIFEATYLCLEVLEACPNILHTIKCPPYHVISPASSSTKRDWRHRCDISSISTQKCLSNYELVQKFETCDGENQCNFDLRNSGIKPCDETSMIFEGSYICMAPNLITICQFSTGEILCEDNRKIEIVSTMFGRKSHEICRAPGADENQQFYRNVECEAQNANKLVKEKCNGKSNCTLTASLEQFGDPCSGVLKYLEVKFTCRDLSNIQNPIDTLQTESERIEDRVIFKEPPRKYEFLEACPNILHTIQCPTYHVLRIISTSSYHDWRHKCVRSEKNSTQNCLSKKEVGQMFEACEGQNQCNLDLRNSGITPCEKTPTLFEGTYICMAPKLITICQFSTGEIFCHDNDKIEIVSTIFGRKSHEICRASGADENQQFYRNVECEAQNANKLVEEKCNGKSNCFLTASVEQFGDPCSGVLKYLEVKFRCRVESMETSPLHTKNEIFFRVPDTVKKSEIVCPYSFSTLQCSTRNKLNITGIALKMSSLSTCFPLPYSKTSNNDNCLSVEELKKTISKQCNKKTECHLDFQTAIFGDNLSCTEANKFLQIDYNCTGPKKIIICQESEGYINCESNEVIQIDDAIYGRIDSTTCKPFGLISDDRKYQNTNCRADFAKKKTIQSCNGKNSCNVQASNEVYGDPCPDTEKYLEIDYYCVALPSEEDNQKFIRIHNEVIHRESKSNQGFSFICSQTLSSLACMDNYKISEIIRVKLIPFDSNECSAEIPKKVLDICKTLTNISGAVYACKGKTSCPIDVSNVLFRETCDEFSPPQTLIAQYTCNGPKGIVVCENSTGIITCPLNYSIKIITTLFGRKSKNICPNSQELMLNVNCGSDEAVNKVKKLCNGKNECSLYANSQEFDDPCPETAKYLEVDYFCKETETPLLSKPTIEPESFLVENNPQSSLVYTHRSYQIANSIICGIVNTSLACSPKHQMKILSLKFETSSLKICPIFHQKEADHVVHCLSESEIKKMFQTCKDKDYCLLNFMDKVFGDNCEEDPKFITVEYACQGPNSIAICDAATATIYCPSGQHIRISSAFFGRNSPFACRPRFQQINEDEFGNIECSLDLAFQKASEHCNGKRICNLDSFQKTLDDPCPGTRKYLKIQFFCDE